MPLAVPDWESLERSSAGLSGQVPPGSRDDDYCSTDHLLPLVPGREPHRRRPRQRPQRAGPPPSPPRRGWPCSSRTATLRRALRAR